MSTDRHFEKSKEAAPWVDGCLHCGRPMKQWWKYKYGSDACKQAAYRLRKAKQLPPTKPIRKSGPFGGKQSLQSPTTNGRVKGGAA